MFPVAQLLLERNWGEFLFPGCTEAPWMFVEGPGGEFSAGMQQRERECVSSKLAQCKLRRESSMGLFPFQMCGSSQDKFEDTAAHLGQAAEKRLLALAVKNKKYIGGKPFG